MRSRWPPPSSRWASSRLDLVEVARPGVAGQRGRRARSKLGRARHHPGLALRPLRGGGGGRRHIGARGRARLNSVIAAMARL